MNHIHTMISATKNAKQKMLSSVQKSSMCTLILKVKIIALKAQAIFSSMRESFAVVIRNIRKLHMDSSRKLGLVNTSNAVDTFLSLVRKYIGVKKRWIAVLLVIALLTTSVQAALERQVSNEMTFVASENQTIAETVATSQKRGTITPSKASAPQKRGTVTPPKEYKLYYHFQDHLGNTVLTTDADSNIVEVIDYKPFGEINVHETYGDYKSSHTYNDKENDPETDLYYYGQRYYDGGTSKFTSIDPALFDQEYLKKSLADPQRLNSYSYAKNNPVNMIDPNGETPMGFAFWGSISVGLSMKGYKIASAFLYHAMNFWAPISREKAPLNYNAGSYVSNNIKNSDIFQEKYKDIKNDIARGDLSGSVKIDFQNSNNKDLLYSFGRITVNYQAVEVSEGQFNIYFTIDDVYNFDEFRTIQWLDDLEKEGITIGDIGNDIGRLSGFIQELESFDIRVKIQENNVEIKKKIRVPREDSLD